MLLQLRIAKRHAHASVVMSTQVPRTTWTSSGSSSWRHIIKQGTAPLPQAHISSVMSLATLLLLLQQVSWCHTAYSGWVWLFVSSWEDRFLHRSTYVCTYIIIKQKPSTWEGSVSNGCYWMLCVCAVLCLLTLHWTAYTGFLRLALVVAGMVLAPRTSQISVVATCQSGLSSQPQA